MSDENSVATHYTHGALLSAIADGLGKLGKSPENVAVDDLGPVDEFHIGGRVATKNFLDQFNLGSNDHVLDVGCGLGGASRFAAHQYDCRVTGVDLTDEFIQTGNALCGWVGLAQQVDLTQGDATATAYADGFFDKAFMLHVGMNIPDKAALARELFRVIRPGGAFGVYDVMRTSDDALVYPAPWASAPEDCAIGTLGEYRNALEAAGFVITAERNRREFAIEFFDKLLAAASNAKGPPPLGLHILMGETAQTKIRNMIDNISKNRIAPVELFATKAL
jgi:SAM-dependent methyltransferase